MTPPPAPRPPAAVSLASLARAVRRYSLVFALFVFAAAAAGAGVWFFLPLPNWTVSSTFRVAMTPPGVVNAVNVPQLDFVTYKQQQHAILRSKVLMAAALADPAAGGLPMLDQNKVGDPVAWLVSSLKIDYPLGPEYMRLALEGDEPAQLVALMKAVGATYRKAAEERDRGGRRERFVQLEKTHQQYTAKLEDNRKKITDAMKRLNVGDSVTLMYRERFTEGRIASTQGQLAQIAHSLRDNDVDILTGNNGTVPTSANVADAVLDELVKNSPDMRRVNADIETIAAEIEREMKNVKPDQPTARVVQLRADRLKLDEELKKLPPSLRVKIAADLKDKIAADNQRRADTQKQKVALLRTYERVLKDDLTRLITERTDMTNVAAEVSGLKQEVVTVENYADQVATAIEAMKPELDAPARVAVWEEPSVSPGVEGNRRAKYTGMAAGGLLLFGLVFVQWLEYRGRRVQTAEEVSQGTGLAVIGNVPYIPKTGRSSDQGVWMHLLTEAVNTTRTMILNPRTSHDGPPPRSILVTSASSGEGKTSISTHLAVSLAGAGRRVLLIDADMRRPTAHVVLGVANGPGLAEYLTGAIDETAAVVDCRVDGLHVIPSGRWQAAAAAALTTERWRDLLRVTGERYDYVLIDSPPVLPVADALSIARTVDAVLFAVMRDRSRFAAVVAACNRLQMVGARLLGVVLSGTTASNGYYYDRDYYRATVEAQETAAAAK